MELTTQLAANNYSAAKPVTQPDAGSSLGTAAREFVQVLESGEATAKQALSGSADPHALVEALAQSELAIQTAVSVRDKVVEAYQEILRMPV
ncbi:flagellar hook-basal body complex protein FliE [uncultured Litoreibacter sp.]|uniref:flagellar hook-basal body complex protein FliE n=1 Tax=uncultured Litoreibacter sp. TaxID=1392394 RepID=UPI00260D040D|nr:flagellar hook-basal body complex protein FliE [uncultured Litoreibacter sp.]